MAGSVELLTSEDVASGQPWQLGRFAVLGPRTVFVVAGVTYAWSDVFGWAAARRLAAAQHAASRRGLALFDRGEELHDPRLASDRDEAAVAFRYARRLFSAEQLADWLGRWDLTDAEWREHVDRQFLLARRSDPASIEPSEKTDLELVEVEYVDAVCCGLLERAAVGLATDVALAESIVGGATDGTRLAVEDVIAAAELARQQAEDPTEIDREVARHRFDWTEVELDLLELDVEAVAREAALAVRLDGRGLAEVANVLHVPLSRRCARLCDLEPKLMTSLQAAKAGELVGPLAVSGGYVLAAVRSRRPPRQTDTTLRTRAAATLVERAARRASETRVEWHEHF